MSKKTYTIHFGGCDSSLVAFGCSECGGDPKMSRGGLGFTVECCGCYISAGRLAPLLSEWNRTMDARRPQTQTPAKGDTQAGAHDKGMIGQENSESQDRGQGEGSR